MKPETKLDIQTWAGYIQQELFALFVFSEQSGGVQQDRDVKIGLEEQAQQSSSLPPQRRLPLHDALIHMYRAFSSNGQRLHDARINELHHLTDFYLQSKCTSPFSRKAVKRS